MQTPFRYKYVLWRNVFLFFFLFFWFKNFETKFDIFPFVNDTIISVG